MIDPKRRKTVAEVLSIDTSESMGACHCAGDDDDVSADRGGRRQQDRHQPRRGRAHDRRPLGDRRGRRAGVELAAPSWVIELQQLPPADVVDRGLRSLQPVRARRTSGTRSTTPPKRCSRATPSSSTSSCSATGSPTPGSSRTPPTRRASCTRSTASPCRCSPPGRVQRRCSRTSPSPATGASTPGPTWRRSRRSWPRKRSSPAATSSPRASSCPRSRAMTTWSPSSTASPPLLGYVATTAKPQATTLLRIGPDRDPLLATLAGRARPGVELDERRHELVGAVGDAGTASSTSGAVSSRTRCRRATSPAPCRRRCATAGSTVDVEGRGPFPDGAGAVATIAGPDGQIDPGRARAHGDRSLRGCGRGAASGSYAVSGVRDRPQRRDRAVVEHAGVGEAIRPSTCRAGRRRLPRPAERRHRRPRRGARRRRVGAGGLRAGSPAPRLLTLPLILAAAILWPLAVLAQPHLAATRHARRGARARRAPARRRRVSASAPRSPPRRPRSGQRAGPPPPPVVPPPPAAPLPPPTRHRHPTPPPPPPPPSRSATVNDRRRQAGRQTARGRRLTRSARRNRPWTPIRTVRTDWVGVPRRASRLRRRRPRATPATSDGGRGS